MNNEMTWEWERESTEAWDYSCFENREGWTVVAHKVGTAGTLDTYTVARECHDLDTDEWYLNPTNQIFTGLNAREEIYEYLGL